MDGSVELRISLLGRIKSVLPSWQDNSPNTDFELVN